MTAFIQMKITRMLQKLYRIKMKSDFKRTIENDLKTKVLDLGCGDGDL